MGTEKSVSDIWTLVTFQHLLATRRRGFDGGMNRHTFRLPPHLHRALAKHAESRRTNLSDVVREALTTYLLVEGNTQRMNTELDALRDEQRATQILMKELMARLPTEPPSVEKPPSTDRVRALFDHINQKEDPHGKGNR
jgi:Arc/MetJ-type ribon-helix-helix transcriptional regulator